MLPMKLFKNLKNNNMKQAILVFFLLASLSVFAQDKIYVLEPYDKLNNVKATQKLYIRSQMKSAFANSPHYQAIDMIGLDALIDIRKFYEEGYLSKDAKTEFGKIPGCKYILKTEIAVDDKDIVFEVSLLEIETLVTVPGKSTSQYVKNDKEMIKTACEKIIAAFFGNDNGGGGGVSISSFTDTRDGKTYKTVKIGNQTWMAENLNYSTGNSWCYDNNTSNCSKYGRLYDWETAKKACPRGWHLPSKSEFEILLSKVGGEGSNAYHALKDGGSSGFSALFGGWRYFSGNFYYIGSIGYWWSSTEYGTNLAWYLGMYSYFQDASMYYNNYKENGFSVRCLQD